VPDAEDCGEAPGLSDPNKLSHPDLTSQPGGIPSQKPPKDLQQTANRQFLSGQRNSFHAIIAAMEENMHPKPSLPLRLIIPSAALFVGSACIFSLPAASAASPQVVVVTATRDGGDREEQTPNGNGGTALTATFTPELTKTSTTAPITLTAGQDLSCVKGPQWILFEWVARVEEGQTVPLLAKSQPEWPDYYFARTAGGDECWIFGGSSTISGDASSLPVREAPPLPEVTYTVENKTGLHIIDMFIRPKGETAWGADRIAAAINPGASFSLDLTAGFYDVRILDPVGGVIYEAYDRAIGSEPSSHTTVLNLEVEVYFQSNYAFDVCAFSFRGLGGDWEVLRTAADGHVTTGQRVTFKMLAGLYDLMVYRCTGPAAGPIMTKYVGPAIPGYIIP
jgi:hypothetical protein